MDAQEHNFCLVNMPELVVVKILANIHNPSSVARSCKYLYEIVCGMEKRRRVLGISARNVTSSLNIDTDAVFDSIMNSHRTIKEMGLRVNDKVSSGYVLNERQLERMTAIMKRFGATVTSLNFDGFALPIGFILELLQQAPKLESLSFTQGGVMGSFRENAVVSLQLPSLKALSIDYFPGLLDIINLIPAGSLNSVCYNNLPLNEPTTVLRDILMRQYNTKSLTLSVHLNHILNDIRVDHLQLETLTLKFNSWQFDDNSRAVEILKCQTNLKEFRFISHNFGMSGSLFRWICNNLKKLEVFDVHQMDQLSTERNAFEMLGELKQLQHFRTADGRYLFDNGLQPSQFKSDAIEKLEFGFRLDFHCGERLSKVVNSMAHNLRNLTHLQMSFENFSALCFVLGHCTKIIHLTSCIGDTNADELTQQLRFPNIQHLELRDFCCSTKDEMLSRRMTPIVRAMPNLKSITITIQNYLKFNVQTMNEFIKESKSLEYLDVSWFALHEELSTDDVIETIRCLTDQLKGYRIYFRPSASGTGLNFDEIKSILRNEFYVRDVCPKLPFFILYKGGTSIPYF